MTISAKGRQSLFVSRHVYLTISSSLVNGQGIYHIRQKDDAVTSFDGINHELAQIRRSLEIASYTLCQKSSA